MALPGGWKVFCLEGGRRKLDSTWRVDGKVVLPGGWKVKSDEVCSNVDILGILRQSSKLSGGSVYPLGEVKFYLLESLSGDSLEARGGTPKSQP